MDFIKTYFASMGAKDYIAQFIGFIAMALMILSFQKKTRREILMMQLVSEIFWVVHYGMIGAYTGMALNILGVVRCYVYAERENKKGVNKSYVPFIFFFGSILMSLASWEGPRSLLPMAAVCITSFVLWFEKAHIVRVLSYPGCTCWLIFNLLSGSWAGVITEVFNLSSITVGIVRHDLKHYKKHLIKTP